MREKGFQLALSESKLRLENKFIYQMSPTDVTPQERFMKKIQHSRNDLPTALFCECDYMAISVIKSLTNLGINVPNDISVIGFDNIWEAQIIHPELTTIDVKKDKIAAFAVEKLIRNIENKNNERIKLFVDTDLVVRNSTKENQKIVHNF